jgi:hypothetical protein
MGLGVHEGWVDGAAQKPANPSSPVQTLRKPSHVDLAPERGR